MAVWSITLRLVLVLALVLNGAGAAVAGVRMTMGHDHALQVSDAPKKHGALHHAGCPEHATHDVAVGQHGEHQPAKGLVSTPNAPAPDCCKGDMCQCACTHLTQVVAPAVLLGQTVFRRLIAVDIPATGRPAPVLPHLIRPPIG